MISSCAKSRSFDWNRAVRLVGSRQFAIILTLLLLAVAGSRAAAQDIVGRISGTVTDSSGSAIPNAKVVITNEATLIVREVTADKNGYYAADQLPAANVFRMRRASRV